MRKIALGFAAMLSLAATGTSYAADMPLKARPMLAAPVWSWTGAYIGANIGYSWGRSRDTETISNAIGTPLALNSFRDHMNGVVGGGQIGYNWQANNFVYGLEADIQGSGQKGSGLFGCAIGVCTPGAVILVAPGPAITGTLSQKLEWFGTLRARAGLLFVPSTLLYVTGGLAYGEVKSSLTVANGAVANAFSNSSTRAGWTIGAGVESKLSANWSAKLEYLYVDLGSVSNTFATTIPALGGGFLGVSGNSRVSDNILRAGLNYKFN